MSEVSSKRPLESLTREECQVLFAAAFGDTPPVEQIRIFTIHGPITIGHHQRSIILYPNGAILAQDHGNGDRDSSVYIYARKLITQLDAYNVAFGADL